MFLYIGTNRRFDYHGKVDKLVGKPKDREARDKLIAVHWLLDGNIAQLVKYDPYLWYLRGGVERVIERADKERKKNL